MWNTYNPENAYGVRLNLQMDDFIIWFPKFRVSSLKGICSDSIFVFSGQGRFLSCHPNVKSAHSFHRTWVKSTPKIIHRSPKVSFVILVATSLTDKQQRYCPVFCRQDFLHWGPASPATQDLGIDSKVPAGPVGGWGVPRNLYNYLKPNWPLFLKVNPPKQGIFQSKQGSFGF